MYDARTRDRFRILVRGATGAVIVASATAAGALTGLAAHATTSAQSADATKTDAQLRHAPKAARARATVARAPRTIIRWKERPTRTEVHTQTVYHTVPSTGSSLGGGSVSSTSSTPTYTAPSTGGGGGGTQSPPPAPPPPPAPAPAPQPAPAPPPAPSSGS